MESELAESITDPGAREFMAEYRRHALDPDAIAAAVAYAVNQPPGVDVNEIIVRPVHR